MVEWIDTGEQEVRRYERRLDPESNAEIQKRSSTPPEIDRKSLSERLPVGST